MISLSLSVFGYSLSLRLGPTRAEADPLAVEYPCPLDVAGDLGVWESTTFEE